ncbi:hypothetical protein AB0M20_45575, partial [Actinoplanes sp. NPDC051633]
RLWDIAAGKESAVLSGHRQWVGAAAFSPDGRLLATGGADRTVRLWDVDSRQTQTTLVGFGDAVNTLSFSPDGQLLATGSWDGKVRIWNLPHRSLPEAIDKICRAVNRDLTPQERALYLPKETPADPVCP